MVSIASKKNIQSPNRIGDCRRHFGSRHGGWQCAEDVHVLMADLLLLYLFTTLARLRYPLYDIISIDLVFMSGEEGTRFSKYISFHLYIFYWKG